MKYGGRSSRKSGGAQPLELLVQGGNTGLQLGGRLAFAVDRTVLDAMRRGAALETGTRRLSLRGKVAHAMTYKSS